MAIYAEHQGDLSSHSFAKRAADDMPSGEELSTLMGSFTQAYWETNAEGMIVTDSPSWRAYTGQTVGEWLNEGWQKALHPDDRDYAGQQWQEAVQQHTPVNAEFRLAHPDGNWRWTNLRATPILNPDGSVKKWLCLLMDVPPRRQTEDKLRKREEELARVQRIGGIAGIDVTVGDGIEESTGGRSPEYRNLHGLLPDTVYETHADWLQRLHPDDRERAERVLKDALAGTDDRYENEYRIIRPIDGQERWLNAKLAIERDPAGKPVRLIGAHIDITALKQTEAALRSSEERFRLAAQASQLYAWEVDLVRRTVWFSEAAPSVLGYTDFPPEWGDPSTVINAIHPDDQERVRGAILTAIVGNGELTVTFRNLTASGAYLWVESRAQVQRNDTGQPLRMHGVVINVDARIRAEEALSQAHSLTREILESIDDIFFTVDRNFVFKYLNHKAELTWGRQRDELLGKSIWEIFPQAIGSEAYRMQLKVMKDRQPVHFETFSPIISRWIAVSVFPSVMGGLSVYFHDITEVRQAQDALRESEERFRTLVQNLPDYAIFSIDTQGCITDWTEGAQRVKGYTAEEAIGQHISIFFTPEDQTAGKIEEEMTQAAETGRAEREGVCVRKGGKRLWVNEITTAIRAPNGQLVGFTQISRDITTRKQSEESLRESQESLQLILSSIADHGIITTDIRNIITGWNPGAQHLFGYSAEEAIGQPGALIYTPEDRAKGEPQKETDTARRHGRAADERYHIRKDGSRLYISGVMSPLYNNAGQLLGYVKVTRDLTERQQMMEALREADRRKDEFLAMLGHELRNPLAPVRNGLQILSLTAREDEVTSLVSMMNRQIDHLVRLVDDLLDVSRISRGKIELHRERLNLTALVSQAAETIRPLYQSHGRQLHVTLPASPIYLHGDTTRLTQVVNNLLTNGVRYTEQDGEVWLTLEKAGTDAVLRVRDNGIGLTSDQVTVIFDLFVQVDHSLARAQGGLGMGLTLVKRLVEMHGGRVEATSAGLGQGSEFIVQLPIVEKSETLMNTENKNTTAKAPGYRILVVDDNQDSATTLTMLLKLKGHEVQTRYGGRAGLEAAGNVKPQVIILDIGMPEMDGYETCRQIRQHDWGKEMVIVALTGYGQEDDKRKAQEAGFDGHLIKPVDLTSLTQLLDTLFSNERTA
ncbi:PAS domain S-box protein [Larkinella insperata]|uniref:histidine kinase n=1 Tax=Larkinella insperata TaxID=332158 RepID=A0ABW3Q2U3_9BACT|nr:PAS domain S-box protein [Larkinella insperata]